MSILQRFDPEIGSPPPSAGQYSPSFYWRRWWERIWLQQSRTPCPRRCRTLATQFATQIRHALDMGLKRGDPSSRRPPLRSPLLAIGDRCARHHIEAVQAQFPEFTWLGVADEHGRGGLHRWRPPRRECCRATFGFRKDDGIRSLAMPVTFLWLVEGSPSSPQPARPGIVVAVPISQPSGRLVGVLPARAFPGLGSNATRMVCCAGWKPTARWSCC